MEKVVTKIPYEAKLPVYLCDLPEYYIFLIAEKRGTDLYLRRPRLFDHIHDMQGLVSHAGRMQ